ncbi:peptidoglycan-binding protein [Streptomyces kanamyceticus]|uniref:Peptidoglycan-binding protein n=1 Tax=Streptomyces kanamyceticus TaxID=1967 RepID=A0A5J6GRK3_STRKN|nr:peptidoglycan-binding protein [Streptomyces kanamyceticus]
MPELAAGGAGDDGESGEEASGGGRRRRPLRTSLIVLAAIAVAAAAGIAATGSLGGDSGGSSNAAPSGPPATAKVQRTTLTDSETVDGNLGFGDASTVQAPAAASGDTGAGQSGQSGQSGQNGQSGQGGASGAGTSTGTITWLPEAGKVIRRGDPVYRVDQQQVPLLYGSFPLYRTLADGTKGADVKMLEKNLRALGYTGFTVDDTYTSDTAAAVKQWQDDLNRTETGTVKPGDALVADGARRVADIKTSTGAALSGNLLTWTGTSRIVSVDLDVQFEDLVQKGTKATVKLPDNSTVEAEVTDIGTPTTAQGSSGDSGSSGSSGDNNSSNSNNNQVTLPVELTVKDQKGLGRYQAAAVNVTLKAESHKDVLVVPVNALVAKRGGGYAVEVVTADGTKLVPVKLGMFADSKVEVSGTGIKEGSVVGVPK